MTLEEYLGDWLKVIDMNVLNETMKKVVNDSFNYAITPNRLDTFRAFKLCPLKELKIVFIGQDLYPQKNVATGILFGNKKDVIELSPSLNIVKEACINYEIPHNTVIFDQTLESWATQGILMLNSSLTVRVNNPNSHAMIWRQFIICLLKHLSKYDTGIVYVLFGKQAQTFKYYINNKMNNIIEVNHPAYYARTETKMPHEIFKEIDNLMLKKYNKKITWFNEPINN